MSKALKEAKDRHAHQLGEAHLATRAKHRMLVAERQDPMIMEGIPVHPLEKKENHCSAASTPTIKSVRSRALASPHATPAKRGGRSIARAVEESTEPENEDAWSKVD